MASPVALLEEAEGLLKNKCVPEAVEVLNRVGKRRKKGRGASLISAHHISFCSDFTSGGMRGRARGGDEGQRTGYPHPGEDFSQEQSS